MADLPFPLLPLPESPPAQRRGARLSANGKPIGRPPGARSKRSMDLGRYIEATFGGMTPGQQAAELCLVRPAEVARAKSDAQDLEIVDLDLPKTMLALVVKAERLARALGIKRAEAWLLMTRERADLMPYIHQRQAQAAESKAKPPATVFMIPEGAAQEAQQLVDFSQDADDEALEILERFEGGGQPVGNRQSDD